MQRVIKQYIALSSCATNNTAVNENIKVQPQLAIDTASKATASIALKYFPNPVATQLTIQITKGAIDELFIADLHGRIVQRLITKNTKQTMLDVSKYPAGQYLIMYKGATRLVAEPFLVMR